MTTKIDVISGFVGAGKTTLINKLIGELANKELIALVENEFGEIGIDGSILKYSGIKVKEISGGCICCTLFGNFIDAIKQLISEFHPNRILVEPTGLGKLSDVLAALALVAKTEDITLNILATVVDPLRFDLYKKMFGDFFFDQISETNIVILSKTQFIEKDFINRIVRELMGINNVALILSQPWDSLPKYELLHMLEGSVNSPMIVGSESKSTHNHHN
jgi:G3E family GTPase